MNWAAFHFFMAWACVWYALADLRPKVGRQHVFGAEIVFGVWIASWAARNILDQWDPLAAYASIDLGALIIFFSLMIKWKAIWAAVEVIIHGASLVLHLAHSVIGRVDYAAYAWILNTLFFMAVMTVFIATAAGRHAWGERLDNALMARFRGWSWSGLIRSGGQLPQSTVA